MRLRLQSNPYMLDRPRQHGISEACECTGEVVLRIAQGSGFVSVQIPLLEGAAGIVEGAKLHGDAGADAD
jgi:hypothetical protein